MLTPGGGTLKLFVDCTKLGIGPVAAITGASGAGGGKEYNASDNFESEVIVGCWGVETGTEEAETNPDDSETVIELVIKELVASGGALLATEVIIGVEENASDCFGDC